MIRFSIFAWLAAASLLGGCFWNRIGGDQSPILTKIGSCNPTPCISVEVEGPPVLPQFVAESARESIDNELRGALYASLEVEQDLPTREQLLDELTGRLHDSEGVGEASIEWLLRRTASVVYSDAQVTSCEVTNIGYLGGAHGFRERRLMTFDSQTGRRLELPDIIPDESLKILSRIVEAEFRKVRSIRPDQSLEDAGFFISSGQDLPLGDNFVITADGLEIHYNPYEVAPYAWGETRLLVPREAIVPLVKAQFRGVFKNPPSVL